MTKTQTSIQKKNVPLAEPEDDDVEIAIEDSGIISDEGHPDEKEAACEASKTDCRDGDVFIQDQGGGISSAGTNLVSRDNGTVSPEVPNGAAVKAASSIPSEPTVVQMNGNLDLEQAMDVNGNGTGKSRKWFEQKIAELEELDKSSMVAVDGGSSVSDRMTDLDGLVPGVEMVDFAEKYFNVHSSATGYTSALSKTVSMVRRRSISVSAFLFEISCSCIPLFCDLRHACRAESVCYAISVENNDSNLKLNFAAWKEKKPF